MMENSRDRSNDLNLPPGCRLLGEGERPDLGTWKEALVSCGDHLARALWEYVEMGFECLLEPVGLDDLEGCSHCYRLGGEPVFRVYVRRAGETGATGLVHPAGGD